MNTNQIAPRRIGRRARAATLLNTTTVISGRVAATGKGMLPNSRRVGQS